MDLDGVVSEKNHASQYAIVILYNDPRTDGFTFVYSNIGNVGTKVTEDVAKSLIAVFAKQAEEAKAIEPQRVKAWARVPA